VDGIPENGMSINFTKSEKLLQHKKKKTWRKRNLQETKNFGKVETVHPILVVFCAG